MNDQQLKEMDKLREIVELCFSCSRYIEWLSQKRIILRDRGCVASSRTFTVGNDWWKPYSDPVTYTYYPKTTTAGGK